MKKINCACLEGRYICMDCFKKEIKNNPATTRALLREIGELE